MISIIIITHFLSNKFQMLFINELIVNFKFCESKIFTKSLKCTSFENCFTWNARNLENILGDYIHYYTNSQIPERFYQSTHMHTHIILMRANLRVFYTGAHMKTKTYDIIFFGARRWRWSLGYLVPAMWNKYHLYNIRFFFPFFSSPDIFLITQRSEWYNG